MPNFQIEKSFKEKVIGVDEVGRGSLAGPVYSCACIFYDYSLNKNINLIDDSKKLNIKKRTIAYKHIQNLKKEKKLNFALGYASVKEIEKLNILNATILSMQRAVINLKLKKGIILVDGKNIIRLNNFICKNYIKGDKKSISIAAASIIAKIHRDNYMKKISQLFPKYKWDKNSGYGTKEHINTIQNLGINRFHRKTFQPIKNFIQTINK